jgi:hypothetical protein
VRPFRNLAQDYPGSWRKCRPLRKTGRTRLSVPKWRGSRLNTSERFFFSFLFLKKLFCSIGSSHGVKLWTFPNIITRSLFPTFSLLFFRWVMINRWKSVSYSETFSVPCHRLSSLAETGQAEQTYEGALRKYGNSFTRKVKNTLGTSVKYPQRGTKLLFFW